MSVCSPEVVNVATESYGSCCVFTVAVRIIRRVSLTRLAQHCGLNQKITKHYCLSSLFWSFETPIFSHCGFWRAWKRWLSLFFTATFPVCREERKTARSVTRQLDTQKGQVRGVENKTAGRGQKKKGKKTLNSLLALLIRSKERVPIESAGELSLPLISTRLMQFLWWDTVMKNYCVVYTSVYS